VMCLQCPADAVSTLLAVQTSNRPVGRRGGQCSGRNSTGAGQCSGTDSYQGMMSQPADVVRQLEVDRPLCILMSAGMQQ